ncbi:MAG TPA: glutamate-1-semialdehyde 2,1-aminomutase [Acidobacteriota bacterium]|nr:glutamate-1-semialdehyde 2,1-aminomutase [Acidobacteriota bacterium]
MSQSDDRPSPNRTRSQSLFERAKKVMPGGVNSPVRAFRAVGGDPPFIASAAGCRLTGADGEEYIDYIGSWGPMILGHGHPQVIGAVQEAASRGSSYGAPTQLEVEMAEKICQLVPSVDKVRLVNSGTEATMSAVRAARAYSGRDLIFKFDGCYHGHGDSFLVKAGSGSLTLGLADSPGVPADFTRHTVSLPFNDLDVLSKAFQEHAGKVGAVILEPVTGNMGVIVPSKDYLEGLLRLCRENGAVAIFDEVMTGFRLAYGGAQQMYGLRPDMTCLGKIVGGGMPLAAYGGRREIMEMVAPQGPVYQAGTLSGNPLAVSAGLQTLRLLEEIDPYHELEERTRHLCQGIRRLADHKGIALQVQQCGSMFTVYFSSEPVLDLAGAQGCDTRRFAAFHRSLLEQGVYFAPSQFEACFVSTCHDPDVLGQTLEAVDMALQAL